MTWKMSTLFLEKKGVVLLDAEPFAVIQPKEAGYVVVYTKEEVHEKDDSEPRRKRGGWEDM